MGKEDKNRESIINLIQEKEREGKVVFWTITGLQQANIEDFIKQPINGLLYDLNRLPEVILSDKDNPKLVNDYATMIVIKKLHEQAK